MSDLVLRVVRADDLLVLRFEFVNLALDPDKSSVPRRLVRSAPAEAALVTVHFPPQHLAEEVFDAATFDFSNEVARTLSAGESRLSFRLPPDLQELPLTIDSLLDWSRFELVSVQEEPSEDPDGPAIDMPRGHQTAIELPFRVTLAPGGPHRWAHHARPAGGGDLVELWHTRLAPPPGAASGVPLAAVWSPDLPGFAPLDKDEFRLSLDPKRRREIVGISRFTVDEEKLAQLQGQSPEVQAQAQRWLAALSQTLVGDALRLSALGGWLRVHSRFTFPPVPPVLLDEDDLLDHTVDPATGDVELFSLVDWSHTIAMGRDQQARTVERGFLFPFGHRADRVTITVRRFLSNGILAELEGYLVQRQFLVIQEPVRAYAHPGLPFVRVEITIPVAPEHELPSGSGHFIPRVGGAPFAFPVRATDHAGSTAEVGVPMVWVPVNELGDLGEVAREYDGVSRVEFPNRSVAFAPDDERPGERAADGPGRTTLKALAIEFAHGGVDPRPGGPSFEPMMKQADVRLPAVDQLGLPVHGASRIRLHRDYVEKGLAGIREGVFAEIIDGLPLKLPADQAGGLVALEPPRDLPSGLPVPPGLKLDGLSLTHGAVPNVNGLVNGFTSGQAIEGLAGRLLGVIDLKEVIDGVTGSGDLPKLQAKAVPGGHEVTFTWVPPLKSATLPAPLRADGDPALSISGRLFRPGGAGSAPEGPTAEVDGTLRNIALTFVDVLTVGFSRLRFHTKTGQKPDFSADIKSFAFTGDLEFVNELAQLLRDPGASGGSPGGPAIAVTPEGISAGLTMTIPSFELGAFGLRDLSFSSTLTLYFSNEPAAIRFALSSPEDPFLLSYSIFGGGGHFALTASTQGASVEVEASLEFGATASVNLFVARGTAQVMAGILFSMKGEKVVLGGQVRIHGCLEVLAIVTISVDFHLSLVYDAPNATARASLTVMVRVLAFSKSVTLEIERSFNTEAPLNRSFEQAVSRQDWRDYCEAFA